MISALCDLVGKRTDHIGADITDFCSDHEESEDHPVLAIQRRQEQKRQHEQEENRRGIHHLLQHLQTVSGTEQLNPESDAEECHDPDHEQRHEQQIDLRIQHSQHGQQHRQRGPERIRGQIFLCDHPAELLDGDSGSGNREKSEAEQSAESLDENGCRK